MANKHYHVFDGSGARIGPVIEVPVDATNEELLTELLATHSTELPELESNETIRVVGQGQIVSVFGDTDQICLLVMLPGLEQPD
jgi:hypothetical protein